jgi:hypothetical protein
VADLDEYREGGISGQTMWFDVDVAQERIRPVSAKYLFASISLRYNQTYEPDWVYYASATYAEGAAWDYWENGFLNGFRDPEGTWVSGFFEHPDISFATYEQLYGIIRFYGYYESFILFKFLTEFLGDQLVIQKIWENLRFFDPLEGPLIWEAIEKVVHETRPEIGIEDVWEEFSRWNYTQLGKYREDGGAYRDTRTRFSETGHRLERREDNLGYLATHYIELSPDNDYGDLVLTFSSGDTERLRVSLLIRENGMWLERSWPVAAAADTVQNFGSSVSRVVVVANVGHPKGNAPSESEKQELAASYALEGHTIQSYRFSRAYPNPFRGRTTVSFVPDREVRGKLEVFDVTGRRVWSHHPGALLPHPHVYIWEGVDDNGRAVPAGVYFLQVTLGDRTENTKVTKLPQNR